MLVHKADSQMAQLPLANWRMITGFAAILAGMALLLAGWLSRRATDAASPAPLVTQVSANSQATRVGIPIEKVTVGTRVPANNPTGEIDDSLGYEVDPANWRKLTLRAPKRDGGHADVVLLRPQWWLDERVARVGGTVHIAVPECGIEGHAEVLEIGDCPPIPEGPGSVVIGTFHHQATRTLNVFVEDLPEPIGVTANHPFWSVDRQTFVPADELRVGERLQGYNGERRIVLVESPGQAEPVFNLEVHRQHVYEVSSEGMLVHNAGNCTDILRRFQELQQAGRRAPDAMLIAKAEVLGQKAVAADPKLVVNALSHVDSQYFYVNGVQLLLDRKGMKHILERHHPKYWDGTVKSAQTFLPKNMSIEEMQKAIAELLKQNRDIVARIGANGIGQIEGVYDGVHYVLGINRGRIGQFYSP